MIKFLKTLFGDSNERSLKKIWPIVEEINEEYEKLRSSSDEELQAKTGEFKQRIKEAVAENEARQAQIRADLRREIVDTPVGGDGQVGADTLTMTQWQDLSEELDDLEQEWLEIVEETLDDLLPEAFAVVKRACEQMVGKTWEAGGAEIQWDMVPYDVQLLGGVVLHQGRIAEMKTGEGKTLVAIAPLYLNALAGRGAHLVTVNPYLAQRDAEWMKPIFEYLGLTVDVIDAHEPHSEGRRSAYRADISYGTNNEFGFDYLRDHSFVTDPAQLVQREHFFAIVDEVDSVLIDEARTPLIISGPVPQANDSRFDELKPVLEKLAYAQQKLVAQLVSEAERKLQERDQAQTAGENKKASELESEAGLALLRAHRGFRRNKKLQKLLAEPGMEQLRQRTEFFYLQENAKNMPFVDEALYYAVDEKQHSIEMSDKGRDFVARAAGEDVDLFILPDMGTEIAHIEEDYNQKLADVEASLESNTDLSEQKREDKLLNDQRVLKNDFEEKKRALYTLYSERAERLHAIEQLLRAYTLFEKDINYIVQEGKVMIVDEHTGRVLPGRRYSDGLHQAIEAKESVKVQAATQTYATITLQNYFRMYDKLAGMTGTAETEAEEFFKIYKTDVVVIPTHKPIQRQDLDDLVFKTKREKYNAVIDQIKAYHEKGQPVLVGTTSVEVSETLSRMLSRQNLPHNVLNAKRDRAMQEALIVAQAGLKGAVTIATNMAGRGTDIKLGSGVRELGGLAILGTERHESRRIDLQLRGRAGRQGDPGESQFYVSLEDTLMSLFLSDRIARVMDRLNLEEGAVITHPWVNKSIERAQRKVEQNNFAIRKRQLEYDDVLNAQRQVIYDRRTSALLGDRLRGDIMDMLQKVAHGIVVAHYGEGDFDGMREELLRVLALDLELDREEIIRLGEDGVEQKIVDTAEAFYNRKRDALARPFNQSIQHLLQNAPEENRPSRVVVDFSDGRRLMRVTVKVDDILTSNGHEVNDALERVTLLSLIDEHWTEHLRGLDEVKEGIGLRAFGQRDPLIEYKMEAFGLFAQMMETINHDVVAFIFKAGPLVNEQGGARTSSSQSVRRRLLDPTKAQSSHASAEPSYGVQGGGAGSAAKDPTVAKKPVVNETKLSRNQMVTIQNPTTGEVETLKYKHAQRKIDEGWSLVS